jgi:hypothetical protein
LSGSTKTIIRIVWNREFANRPETLAQRNDPSWYRYRWELWKTYTEPSLLRQTHGDFEAWLLCDPMLASLTDFMERDMPDPRFRVVYNANDAARKVKADKFFYVRIDNDDMFCDTALQDFHECQTNAEYIQFTDGWAYNHETGELASWVNPSPAFICRVGGPDMFAERLPEMMHHGRVCEVAEKIGGKRFMVVTHGNNVCNSWRGRFIGPLIGGEEKSDVLRTFGLEKILDKPGNCE